MTEWNAELYRERSTLQQTMAAEVLASLELKGSERVLDVGCGDGRITAEIASRLTNGSVVGVDASMNMVELASRNSRPNLRFEVAEASSTMFIEASTPTTLPFVSRLAISAVIRPSPQPTSSTRSEPFSSRLARTSAAMVCCNVERSR